MNLHGAEPLHHLGYTRSRRCFDHMLQTPDTFVYAPLPGMVDATAVVHAAPALGAAFTQYTAVLQPGGTLGPTRHSRFLYVLQGSVDLVRDCIEVNESVDRPKGPHGNGKTESVETSGFLFLPPLTAHLIRASGRGARLVVIEKPYVAGTMADPPPVVFGMEREVASTPLLRDEGIRVRALLGSDPQFDFAVNIMEYDPGARLSMVEVHVMEHGLLMLQGEGIYRLGDAWYPVTAGDFIWMGPFCPQWFGALGTLPARYLIYKDWNRHPLAPNGLDGTRG